MIDVGNLLSQYLFLLTTKGVSLALRFFGLAFLCGDICCGNHALRGKGNSVDA